jgi:hypothetical protein
LTHIGSQSCWAKSSACLIFLLEGLGSHRPESKQFQMTKEVRVYNYNLET